jgi:hypothetical protein
MRIKTPLCASGVRAVIAVVATLALTAPLLAARNAQARLIAQASGEFPAVCESGFRCELIQPVTAFIDSSPLPIDVTATSPFTLTFAFSPTFEQLNPGVDLTNLSVTVNAASEFASQRYNDGRYEVGVRNPGVAGNYNVIVKFKVQEAATTVRTFETAVLVRVRLPATITPTPLPTATPPPTATPVPTAGSSLTPTPGPTLTPFRATRWYLPIAYQNWCASAIADWCEPNGSIATAFDRLAVGTTITATVRRVVDVNDVYRVVVTDTTPVTIAIGTTTPGVDLDLQLYTAERLVCGSTFTGRSDERIVIGATPCSTDADYRTTRLAPGTYFIRVFLFLAPDDAPVEYSLAIAR